MRLTCAMIDVSTPGGVGVLVPVQRSVPVLAPHEVLIEVHAAEVNRADLKQREDAYPMSQGMPTVSGLDPVREIESTSTHAMVLPFIDDGGAEHGNAQAGRPGASSQPGSDRCRRVQPPGDSAAAQHGGSGARGRGDGRRPQRLG